MYLEGGCPLVALVAVLVLGPVTQVLAQGDCYRYSGCTECATQPHCGWCATAASCWGGEAAGPTNPRQTCDADDWNFDKCKAVRLRDGERFAVKEPVAGFYDYFDLSLLYPGQDVTIEVDDGAATTRRRLFASQAHSLPRANQHEWEGKVRGSLLELRLGASVGVDYTKPLFLSVLNDVPLRYTIVGQMVPPSSGGALQGCSFAVSNTTFGQGPSLLATSAISKLCRETGQSADAFLLRLLNGPSPLSDWEVVSAVTIEIYKSLLTYGASLETPEGYQTLRLTATGPYPYQGPKVLTLWKRRGDGHATAAAAAAASFARRPPAVHALRLGSCSSNPSWEVQGHSGSLDETTQFWIATVFNEYLCAESSGIPGERGWDWKSVHDLGIRDHYWAGWRPVQTSRGWRWSVAAAAALDRPEVHWIWTRQSNSAGTGTDLFVVLESVPVVPGSFSPAVSV